MWTSLYTQEDMVTRCPHKVHTTELTCTLSADKSLSLGNLDKYKIKNGCVWWVELTGVPCFHGFLNALLSRCQGFTSESLQALYKQK